jgi:transposase-like protein
VRAQFDNRNIELFERSLNGESVAALASAYGISEDAVYRARQRIRERLQELIAMQVRAEDGVDDEP